MRVYHTRSLLNVAEGADDILYVAGRLRSEISEEDENSLKELPRIVVTQFNTFATIELETIDYASEPTAYMPDEFTFHLDVEGLGRLAREMLIRMIPPYAEIWEAEYKRLAELWVGGKGELLNKDKRAVLKRRMREVWSLPVRGKTFVVDRTSLRDEFKRAGTDEAIRLAGGIVNDKVTPNCDYFVTDKEELAEAARRQGAKQVVDTLTLTLMIGTKE